MQKTWPLTFISFARESNKKETKYGISVNDTKIQMLVKVFQQPMWSCLLQLYTFGSWLFFGLVWSWSYSRPSQSGCLKIVRVLILTTDVNTIFCLWKLLVYKCSRYILRSARLHKFQSPRTNSYYSVLFRIISKTKRTNIYTCELILNCSLSNFCNRDDI